jgi:hypothetical protein
MSPSGLFMAIKDGIIVEPNLTPAEARAYRGTDIRVVPQRKAMNMEMNLVTAVRFRRRAF